MLKKQLVNHIIVQREYALHGQEGLEVRGSIDMKWSSNNAVFVLQVARPFLAFCVILLIADFLKLTPRSRGD
tara:strand:- start:3587 stop:3802 length:216 start_codon:yes stop_codon:yes gene_type:complete